MTEIKELTLCNLPEIKALFVSVFTRPPWNDDWSDAAQLDAYLRDIMHARTPLAFGLYDGGQLAGISLGNIRHWWCGTEYYIEEFCIKTELQRRGLGSRFLGLIEDEIRKRGVSQLFLITQRNVPAYGFYKKHGFTELEQHVSFFKELNRK